jgi:hypothetical protein
MLRLRHRNCRHLPEARQAAANNRPPSRDHPIIRVIVWCKDCRHQVEPNSAEQMRRYGAETAIPDRSKRLVCSKCGSGNCA